MKKIALGTAACLALSLFAWDLSYAAPKDEVKQQVHQMKEKQQQKKKQKQVEKQNKSELQQFKSIDKQIDKIEEKLNYYQNKLAKLDEKVSTSDAATITSVNNQSTTDDSAEIEVDEEIKKYPGYKGKFNALKNRLNGVSNRLDALTRKGADDEERQERYDRLETLLAEVNEAIATLEKVETELKEDFIKNTNVKKLDTKTNVSKTKEWKIKFSKQFDQKTLSSLDIVVIDANQNLIETTLNYSKEMKSVTITPSQAYESGKTYTLYIGNDISTENGLNLENAIKMNFTVK